MMTEVKIIKELVLGMIEVHHQESLEEKKKNSA